MRPLRLYWILLALAVASAASIAVLPWDLSALGTAEGWASAWQRSATFFAGFADPDLSATTLWRAWQLAEETLAMAILGVLGGALLAYPISLLASAAASEDGRSIEGPRAGSGSWRRRARWLLREAARLLLDVLRGVPDFAWALIFVAVLGPSPLTGICAIAVNVSGILGKITSELWDGVPPRQYSALRSTGATPLQTLFYGIQPVAGRGMLSFLLMRLECAVRNASVIGVVAGGGLGGAIFQEFGYDNKGRAVTYLAAALLLTAGVDVLSNVLRSLLRSERAGASLARARRRRWLASAATLLAIGMSFWWIRTAIVEVSEVLRRVDLGYLGRHFGALLLPDLHWATLVEAARGAAVPLALGFLATIASTALATWMAYLGSVSFQGRSQAFAPEHRPPWVRAWRWAVLLVVRIAALLSRGIPEVAWVWILALFFRLGMEAALGALILHSTGVLARVFTETVDNHRYGRLEHVAAPSRRQIFLYGALPLSRTDWTTYALFQFEVNVRAGVMLGIVGIGGLGFMFRQSLTFGEMHRASTFMFAMVLLTTVIDRLSRRVKHWRAGC